MILFKNLLKENLEKVDLMNLYEIYQDNNNNNDFECYVQTLLFDCLSVSGRDSNFLLLKGCYEDLVKSLGIEESCIEYDEENCMIDLYSEVKSRHFIISEQEFKNLLKENRLYNPDNFKDYFMLFRFYRLTKVNNKFSKTLVKLKLEGSSISIIYKDFTKFKPLDALGLDCGEDGYKGSLNSLKLHHPNVFEDVKITYNLLDDEYSIIKFETKGLSNIMLEYEFNLVIDCMPLLVFILSVYIGLLGREDSDDLKLISEVLTNVMYHNFTNREIKVSILENGLLDFQ